MIGTKRELITALMDAPPDKKYELKEHREKRTLNQNSYYWALLTKVADKTDRSRNRCHNEMLASYGQDEFVDDRLVYVEIPDNDRSENQAMESATFHLRPTSSVMEGNNGILYRVWVLMRGSSTYNTAEMRQLLDGLIDEAKQIGIETLPEEELERMYAQANESLQHKQGHEGKGVQTG